MIYIYTYPTSHPFEPFELWAPHCFGPRCFFRGRWWRLSTGPILSSSTRRSRVKGDSTTSHNFSNKIRAVVPMMGGAQKSARLRNSATTKGGILKSYMSCVILCISIVLRFLRTHHNTIGPLFFTGPRSSPAIWPLVVKPWTPSTTSLSATWCCWSYGSGTGHDRTVAGP